VGFTDFQGRKLAFGLGLTGPTVNKFAQFCSALYRMFMETDASIVEVNPLVILKDGGVVALDAKVNFDENALYRHKELLEYRDLAEEEPRETQAKEWDLAYIALDGDIGCMVNGAGLAMATMDTIKLVGGAPANFLDVGGGASKEKVTAAFKLILADPAVKAVLVNIFGGIMKCDVIAEGRSRSWSGWKAPTWRRARSCCATPAWPSPRRTTCGRRLRRPSRPSSSPAHSVANTFLKERHEHPRQRKHEGGLPGHHRLGGLVPLEADAGVRHEARGRCDSGQGRHRLRGQGPRVQHGG
jgi:hypothetical protein